MKSVFWLTPDSIAGRPGPQMAPWSAAELRAAGFDAVLNLSEHPSDVPALAAAGLESGWVPLPTDIPPTEQSLAQCIDALPRAFAFLSGQLSRGRRVLIHCYAGKDRTGMLLALHVAKKENLTAAKAIRRVRKVRPLAITAPGWEPLALEVIPPVAADPAVKKNFFALIALLALAPLVTAQSREFDLPSVIHTAETIVVYSLVPDDLVVTDEHGNRTGPHGTSERFHGFPVHGKVAQMEREETAKVRAALELTLKRPPPQKASGSSIVAVTEDLAPTMCFRPRHGFCLIKGEVHADILLCFECDKVRIIYRTPDGSRTFDAGIASHEALDILNAMLDRRKIPATSPQHRKCPVEFFSTLRMKRAEAVCRLTK